MMHEPKYKQTILVVDDIPDNITILDTILKTDYTVKIATSGKTALHIAQTPFPPDLILLDIMMPGLDGYEVLRRLKANPQTASIPVIFVSAKDREDDEERGLELGAVDYITKPFSPPVVRARLKAQLSLRDQSRYLEMKIRERTAELEETRLEIIRKLGRAAEYKDNETGMHVLRMSSYAYRVALNAGLGEEEADLILHTAPMHDIGKLGVPDNILLKPGPLNDQEWVIMRNHTLIGSTIIGEHASTLMQRARIAALTHHERWNGTGYPYQLKGEEIPIHGRIIAIADVFDALTSKRPYKEPWPIDKALDLIKEQRGEHFDPAIVDAFLLSIEPILAIKERYADR
jgi:putative two-component system response regulator